MPHQKLGCRSRKSTAMLQQALALIKELAEITFLQKLIAKGKTHNHSGKPNSSSSTAS